MLTFINFWVLYQRFKSDVYFQDITGWGDNDRGVSWTFGGDVVRAFLKKHDLSLVARAHQVKNIQRFNIHIFRQVKSHVRFSHKKITLLSSAVCT